MKLFSSQLLKVQYIKKWSESELLDLKPNRNNFLDCSSMKKIFISAYSDNTQNESWIQISRQIQLYIWKYFR